MQKSSRLNTLMNTVVPLASSQSRIVFLDVLRIFAFISVLVGHKYSVVLAEISKNPDTHKTIKDLIGIIAPFYEGGGAGVVVFFLVSGYIILKVADEESPLHFILKRFLRIYPLFIFAVILQKWLDCKINGAPIPVLSEFILQILLLGDFYQIPLSLNGVEWTLRIEIIFYIIIFMLGIAGLLKNQKVTFVTIVLLTLIIQYAELFRHYGMIKGYFALYFPFLFVGSITYLCERDCSLRVYGVAFVIYVILFYLIMLPGINPSFVQSNFMIYGCGVFFGSYLFRGGLKSNKFIVLASGLTYSIYLFHNWLWDFIMAGMLLVTNQKILIQISTPLVLFLFSYCAYRFIERPFIKMGILLVEKMNERSWISKSCLNK